MSYISTIMKAVKALLQAIPGLPQVKYRARPIFWRDEKKVVLLSLTSDEMDFTTFSGAGDSGGSGRVCNMKYTVTVTIMVQRNDQYDEDSEDILLWREQIRQQLFTPLVNGVVTLPGAPTVWNMELGLGNVYEHGGLDRAYDVIPLTVIFHSKEPVNG